MEIIPKKAIHFAVFTQSAPDILFEAAPCWRAHPVRGPESNTMHWPSFVLQYRAGGLLEVPRVDDVMTWGMKGF